jgi:hypothetical protein
MGDAPCRDVYDCQLAKDNDFCADKCQYKCTYEAAQSESQLLPDEGVLL